jgi:DNA polymerase I-like protein with 3'-5' exonuclease and polymerase domains
VIEPITVDFETDAIDGNPIVNPPMPCGVAIWVPGQEPTYLAWGHPTGNNCSFAVAHEYLEKLAKARVPLLFHNGTGFDIHVWETYFCNARFPWHMPEQWRIFHETMFLLFLENPYSTNLSLKPNADRLLDMPPVEQDELRKWILTNIPEATPKTWGGFIARAPGDLVAEYAVGDVIRTRGIFDKLYPQIVELGMEAAYDRERRLSPVLTQGTRRGIRIDRERLEHHERVYTVCHEVAGDRLAERLGCPVDHLDSDELLADALERCGAVEHWVLTPTGKRSMAKDNLKIVIPEVRTLMEYRGALQTCLQTFMRPWLEKSAKDGRLHPNWNQVRQPKDDKRSKGTRTGRLSSDDPNFQNVPTEYEDQQGHALATPEGLHPIPFMRSYCLPEVGHVWIKRDFNSQEIRILAHFEDGALCEAYKGNPDLDPHQMAIDLIRGLTGILYARKPIKITGFSIIYGSGVTGLSKQLRQPYEDAYRIKASYLAAMPGVNDLMQDVQYRGKSGQPIRTWGGRIYYVEPPKVVNGRYMDFAYKLLNYLIQGSAADHTKEAICDWEDTRIWSDTFLATVHDEINISAPKEDAVGAMLRLQRAMDKDRFDVPIRSEGFIGPNWHEIIEETDYVQRSSGIYVRADHGAVGVDREGGVHKEVSGSGTDVGDRHPVQPLTGGDQEADGATQNP